MISGAHAIIYSKNADADRAFLRDVLGLDHVDVGGGWLIFGLPPSEIAVHPTNDEGGTHEVYFLCDDVEALVAAMKARGVPCDPIATLQWGLLTRVTLPGGSGIGIYEPRHARPPSVAKALAAAALKKPAAKPKAKAKAKKPAAKPKAKPKAKAKRR